MNLNVKIDLNGERVFTSHQITAACFEDNKKGTSRFNFFVKKCNPVVEKDFYFVSKKEHPEIYKRLEIKNGSSNIKVWTIEGVKKIVQVINTPQSLVFLNTILSESNREMVNILYYNGERVITLSDLVKLDFFSYSYIYDVIRVLPLVKDEDYYYVLLKNEPELKEYVRSNSSKPNATTVKLFTFRGIKKICDALSSKRSNEMFSWLKINYFADVTDEEIIGAVDSSAANTEEKVELKGEKAVAATTVPKNFSDALRTIADLTDKVVKLEREVAEGKKREKERVAVTTEAKKFLDMLLAQA